MQRRIRFNVTDPHQRHDRSQIVFAAGPVDADMGMSVDRLKSL